MKRLICLLKGHDDQPTGNHFKEHQRFTLASGKSFGYCRDVTEVKCQRCGRIGVI
jgi:hypothetical protein